MNTFPGRYRDSGSTAKERADGKRMGVCRVTSLNIILAFGQ